MPKGMTKKECAEIMKGILQASRCWDENDLDRRIQADEALIKALVRDGATLHRMKQHGLGVFHSSGTSGLIIPRTIQEAIDEPEKGTPPPPYYPPKRGR